eukprot:scaffold299725_cov46-Cyclotella_meneghiniana.AAC.1
MNNQHHLHYHQQQRQYRYNGQQQYNRQFGGGGNSGSGGSGPYNPYESAQKQRRLFPEPMPGHPHPTHYQMPGHPYQANHPMVSVVSNIQAHQQTPRSTPFLGQKPTPTVSTRPTGQLPTPI